MNLSWVLEEQDETHQPQPFWNKPMNINAQKKNTRSPSFQPCSSNKNPGPIVQFQPVPTEGGTISLAKDSWSPIPQVAIPSALRKMDGWINFAAVFHVWPNGNLKIFGGKSPRASGFQQKCWRFHFSWHHLFVIRVIPSYLGIWTGVCSSFY